jgi:hypothetical protein
MKSAAARRVTLLIFLLIMVGGTLGIGSALIVLSVILTASEFVAKRTCRSLLLAVPPAMILVLAGLFGMAICSALLLPTGPFELTAPIILTVPVVVALALRFQRRRTKADRSDESPGTLDPYFLAIPIVALSVIAASLRLRGTFSFFIWAMDNDANTHMFIVRSITNHNGLTLRELHHYPALTNLVAALSSSIWGRRGLHDGHLLVHDMNALAATYLLLFGGIAVAIASCVLGITAANASSLDGLTPTNTYWPV